MAIFKGTVREFHQFVGPKLRNAINGITRSHRLARSGLCELCGSVAELQSAHVHGRGRRTIIERELMAFVDEEGIITCDLDVIEASILQAHLPIEATFKFICQPCHARYDTIAVDRSDDQSPLIDGDFPKLSRIKLWALRPKQVNHQLVRAFLLLERDGEVELQNFRRHCVEEFHVATFDNHFASMKTDAGNAHGRVFFIEGSRVKMWDRVRTEVDRYFK